MDKKGRKSNKAATIAVRLFASGISATATAVKEAAVAREKTCKISGSDVCLLVQYAKRAQHGLNSMKNLKLFPLHPGFCKWNSQTGQAHRPAAEACD